MQFFPDPGSHRPAACRHNRVRIYKTRKKRNSCCAKGQSSNILLADEINRVNPKSQSAFIEAMAKRPATINGIAIRLPNPFFVIATQNPFEFEGPFISL